MPEIITIFDSEEDKTYKVQVIEGDVEDFILFIDDHPDGYCKESQST